jgi:hypothetical protein
MMAGRREEALDHFNRALQADPHYADALTYRGIALAVMDRHEEALADYDRALSIKPGDIEILYNRATSLWVRRAYEEATRDLERVLAIDPDYKYARGTLVQTRLQCSDWHDLASHEAKIAADLAADADAQSAREYHDLRFACIAPEIGSALGGNECAPQTPFWNGERYKHERIRVAYLSGDFRRHAVAQLSAGVFENTTVRVSRPWRCPCCPATAPRYVSVWRKAFDRFIDVHQWAMTMSRIVARHGNRHRRRLDRLHRAFAHADFRAPSGRAAGELPRFPRHDGCDPISITSSAIRRSFRKRTNPFSRKKSHICRTPIFRTMRRAL